VTRKEIERGTRLITQAICEHMPSAAVASGWMSAMDPAPFVKVMCERFPAEVRPEHLGITLLTDWLKEQGVEAGKAFIMEVRKVWLMDRMRAEFAASGAVCFADKT